MAVATRAIWNGAINFGLVNIPVELHSAANPSGVDFDWLDKRTMNLVGYKRINKQTGQEIEKENIVKGIAFEKGQYVILTDDEIKKALPKSTQTIEIESFVDTVEIPLVYFERPYYLSPSDGSIKAYTLLRDTLMKSGRSGIARIVIHSKQHLAAIVPTSTALLLILLRWAEQIRPMSELNIPAAEEVSITEREISMAEQLVESMFEKWDPEKFKDSFTAKVKALVEEKIKTGKIETVALSEEEKVVSGQPDAVDFTELLLQSLQMKKQSVKK